jgi:uncharacterized protein (DUF2237 family)
VGNVDLSDFEVIEEHKPYREWCVPAAVRGRAVDEAGMAREQTVRSVHFSAASY